MISCKDYVEAKKNEIRNEVNFCERKPHLVVIQIGDNPASNSYIKGKKRDCEEVGITITHRHVENWQEWTQERMEYLIKSYNVNPNVDGIIIQLPIPDQFDVKKLQECISPLKDVDGFRNDSSFDPCTPKGIMDWLAYNNVNLVGKDVVVLGRSAIVGKPLVNMMIDAGATVTCCNSKTENIFDHTQYADIVVSAIGKAKYFDFTYFIDVDIIIDVGINRDEDGKLCGDIDTIYFDKYLPNTYVTPVPGGVGLLTRLALLENVLEAYKLN